MGGSVNAPCQARHYGVAIVAEAMGNSFHRSHCFLSRGASTYDCDAPGADQVQVSLNVKQRRSPVCVDT